MVDFTNIPEVERRAFERAIQQAFGLMCIVCLLVGIIVGAGIVAALIWLL